jgi:CRISPR-associated protein Cmr6
MNLKHQFYRAYYKGIDLRKFEEKEDQKKIEKRNEPKFKEINESLFKTVKIGDHPFNKVLKNQWGDQFRTLKLKTTYPGLFLGSGYNHETGNVGEFKLGLHFDHTTGLPTVPGHSVKGVIRSAFPGYNFNRQKETFEPSPGKVEQEARTQYIASLLGKVWPDVENEERRALRKLVHQLELTLFERVDVEVTQKYEGRVHYLPSPKWTVFFDAHLSSPEKQESVQVLGPDAITPHGDDPLRNPIPRPFVKVLPEIPILFAFRIPKIQIADETFTEEQMLALFTEILLSLGIGAKTNVGYGRLVQPKEKDNQPPTSSRKKSDQKKSTPKPGDKPTQKKRTKARPLSKWKPGDDSLIGEVVKVDRKNAKVHFITEMIQDFDQELIAEVRLNLIDRFPIGSSFKLSLIKRKTEQDGTLLVKVAGYRPIS